MECVSSQSLDTIQGVQRVIVGELKNIRVKSISFSMKLMHDSPISFERVLQVSDIGYKDSTVKCCKNIDM